MIPKNLSISMLTVSVLTLTPALAQVPSIGTLGVGASCETGMDAQTAGGELFAVKLTGEHDSLVDEFMYADWQIHMDAKGGATVGMLPPDMAGDTYQVLGGNFTENEYMESVVIAFTTFPNGEISVNSGPINTGFNFMESSVQQVVGNSYPFLSPTAGITLPGARESYTADLGSGPQSYPQSVAGGWRVVWAPVLEVHDDADTVPTGSGCTVAGSVGDIDAVGAPLPWGVVAGYNIYRMPAGSEPPSPEEMGEVANFVYFAPLRPDVIVPDGLSEVVDPDGVPQTGDEAIVFEDLPSNPDGSARRIGLAPSPGRNYWYAFQPVVMGDLNDWAALELVKQVPADYRVDSNDNGLYDSIVVPRWEDVDDGSGPTFLSPQAEWGLTGIGLTNGGLPVISPVVHTAADNEDENCTNGEDDDADGLVDCEDGDCDAHPDCADAGGGIRIGTPGPGPGLIVGWDETMGTRDVGISRGSLAVMWTENRLNHSPIACGLSGLQAVVEVGPGSSFVLASAPGGSSPDYGEDSFGIPRLAPSGPCP